VSGVDASRIGDQGHRQTMGRMTTKSTELLEFETLPPQPLLSKRVRRAQRPAVNAGADHSDGGRSSIS